MTITNPVKEAVQLECKLALKTSSKDAGHMAGKINRAVQIMSKEHFAASQLDQLASTH